MKLTQANTYLTAHHGKFAVNIQMPDGSRNHLHSRAMDLQSAIATRDLIEDQDIDHVNLLVRPDGSYFRLIAIMKINDDLEEFHSRKLNLNDVIYERAALLITDD